MSAEEFFNLHRESPRQGPGEAADVAWVGEQLELPENARIADLACGPGADIGPLLALAAQASVVAIDRQPHFIGEARENWGRDERVELVCGDMAAPGEDFNLIWCAGAVYVLGVTQALSGWRKSLAATGVVAFSEPCFWSERPPADVHDIWADYAAMGNAASIDQRVRAAGFETLATRRLSADAWENYYCPLEERIGGLRETAGPELERILDDATLEIGSWRQYGTHFGYLLSMVRPA